jgi:hypothetical protein
MRRIPRQQIQKVNLLKNIIAAASYMQALRFSFIGESPYHPEGLASYGFSRWGYGGDTATERRKDVKTSQAAP